MPALAGILWADARADRQRREGLEEEIRAALAKGPLSTLPLSEALRLRGLVDEVGALRPRGEVLAAEAADPLLTLAGEFETWHADLKKSGLGDLAIAKDPSQPEGVREFHLLRGQQTLLQASHLFPDDLELRQLAAVESAFPTIAVEARGEEGGPVAAEVFLRTIDVLTSGVGPGVSIGKTPLAATPVRPGYYRVVVAFEGGGFRELVCNPSYAFTEVKLVATANGEHQGSGEGMVRFEACEYTLPDIPSIDQPQEGKAVHLDAFLIDKTEVSNAQYAEFVRATGHPLPSYWKFVEDRERFLVEYGDRPVVGVGWRDAVAFAEWCGKRLPTAAEWLRVAGGVENRPFPYSADPAAPLLGNVHTPVEPTGGERQCWEQYLLYSAPVTSHQEAVTPEGIYNLYGNAFELTETMVVEALDANVAIPRQFDRLAFGGNWRSAAAGLTVRSAEHWSVGPSNDYFYLGFRCAKSVGP